MCIIILFFLYLTWIAYVLERVTEDVDEVFIHLLFMDPCVVVWISRSNQQDASL